MTDVFYNKLEADPSTIGMDVVGGRLDRASATSIKWGFQNSNQIRLVNPTTGRWELIKCASEPTLANDADADLGTGAVALAVDKIYDVFAEYTNGTSFTLVCSPWATTGTGGNSARVAAWAGGTAYKVGQRVSNSDHYYVCKTAHTSHSDTFSEDAAYWVDNGLAAVVGSADFYGLYRHDGVLVSGSDATGKSRRWLGIIYAYNNSATVNFKDDSTYRYVSNFYNFKTVDAQASNSTVSWTYTTGAWRETNNGSGQTRANIILCVSSMVGAALKGAIQVGSGGNNYIGVALNTTGAASASIVVSNNYIHPSLQKAISLPVGFNFLTTVEYGGGD